MNRKEDSPIRARKRAQHVQDIQVRDHRKSSLRFHCKPVRSYVMSLVQYDRVITSIKMNSVLDEGLIYFYIQDNIVCGSHGVSLSQYKLGVKVPLDSLTSNLLQNSITANLYRSSRPGPKSLFSCLSELINKKYLSMFRLLALRNATIPSFASKSSDKGSIP